MEREWEKKPHTEGTETQSFLCSQRRAGARGENTETGKVVMEGRGN